MICPPLRDSRANAIRILLGERGSIRVHSPSLSQNKCPRMNRLHGLAKEVNHANTRKEILK